MQKECGVQIMKESMSMGVMREEEEEEEKEEEGEC